MPVSARSFPALYKIRFLKRLEPQTLPRQRRTYIPSAWAQREAVKDIPVTPDFAAQFLAHNLKVLGS